MAVGTTDTHVAGIEACPYLGLQDDPATCLGYPAEWNLCYHARPAAAVSRAQQRDLCLSPVYARCVVFQGEGKAPLPNHLRGARAPGRWKWILLAALVVLTALGVWAAMQARTDRAFPPAGGLPVGPALEATLDPLSGSVDGQAGPPSLRAVDMARTTGLHMGCLTQSISLAPA